MNQQTEQTESPEFAKIKRLDEKIGDILKNRTLPEAEKAKLYSMAASEYLDLRRRAPETAAVSLSPAGEIAQPVVVAEAAAQAEPEEEEAAAQASESEEEEEAAGPVLAKVHSRLAEKAQNILAAIKGKEDVIGWSPHDNAIVVNGNKIKGTDIGEILNFVTKQKPPEDLAQRPKGVGMFLEALGKANINPGLIPNKTLQNILKRVEPSQVGQGVQRWESFWD